MSHFRFAAFLMACAVFGAVFGYALGLALDTWVLCDMPCMMAELGLQF